jgi:hypothetical protein
MKTKSKWISVLPLLAVVFLSFALVACGDKKSGDITGSGDDDNGDNQGTSVTFSSVTATGSPITTSLSLVFGSDVDGLSADNITLSGSTGATKGTLTRTAVGTYTLTVTGINSAGTVTVAVSKSGYTFNPASKTVTVAFSNKRTVFFNTGADQSIAPIANLDPGAKITAPTETLSKDGFTFDGKWYKDYSFDTATGLRTYSEGDEWDFDTDTVTANMTLYAGRTGGVKLMPLTYIWSNQPDHLQGAVLTLTQGKTYKLGVRYILQPNYGPIQLQARRENDTAVFSLTLEAGSATFFQMAEGQFTATASGDQGYFIGLSQVSSENGGTYIIHEIWLKEVGGGDINLLTVGDFVWKDADVGAAGFNKSTEAANIGKPFWGPGGIRNAEWPSNKWNMNARENHYTTLWSGPNFLPKLSELTNKAVADNAHGSLVFPKPAHP